MKSLTKKYFSTTILTLTILLLSSFNLFASPSDLLKGQLINISGWKAEKLGANNFDMGGMKMLSALRHYSKGNKNVVVTIMAGSNSMMQGASMSNGMIANMETEEFKMTTSTIKGYTVIQNWDKEENTNTVVVNMAKNVGNGAMVLFVTNGMSSKEALKFAKKFNWKKIKSITTKALK